MEKGPFSVEWLAQSSRGGAQPTATARRPRSPPGDTGGRESPADLGESRLSSQACRAAGPLVAAVKLTAAAREAVGGRQPHVRPLPTSPPARPGARRGQGVPRPTPRRPHPVPAAAPREREAAGRSSPEHEAETGGGAAAPGRPRTKFSAAQLQELERSFREQRYIGASEKRRLAAVLNLSQSQVSAAGAPGPASALRLRGETGPGPRTPPRNRARLRAGGHWVPSGGTGTGQLPPARRSGRPSALSRWRSASISKLAPLPRLAAAALC